MFNSYVNFEYLKSRLIPYFLRRPKLLAIFKSICAPIIDVNNLLVQTTEDIEYCLNITGQKIYLEKLLNDCFDEYARRIIIRNNNPNKFLYVYNEGESNDPLIIFNNNELPATTGPHLLNIEEVETLYDYTVIYPSILTTTEDQFKDKINKYNPAGRIYNFETV